MDENKKFEALFKVPDFDEASMPQARRAFRSIKESGIVLAGSFDENLWHLTDEYATYYLNFQLDDKSNEVLDILGLTADEFSNMMKFFVIFHFGLLTLTTFRDLIHQIKQIIYLSPDKSLQKSGIMPKGTKYSELTNFFSSLPVRSEKAQIYINGIIEELETMNDVELFKTSSLSDGRRELAFSSYFIFNDILNDFWSKCTDVHEKLFYYPVYLWWQITAVLPTRPKEFVVTPRNCLSETDDGWQLTLRKSKIKGASKRKGYLISRDFTEHKYNIPDRLAEAVSDYLFLTRDYPKNDINTLFISDPHYQEWGYGRKINSRYYTYVNLSTALKYFYSQIIIDRYGYRLVPKNKNILGEKEIQFVNLGDTRHIAMINMILEGATPVTAMLLAGQENIETAAHYFGNVASLVECRVVREFKRLTAGAESYSLSHFKGPLQVAEFTLLNDGAKCYSPNVSKGDYTDCDKVSGPHGEIGWCENCTYFRSGGLPFAHAKDKYIKQIQSEADYLAKVIDKVRKHQGSNEEIGEALLRLKSSCYTYQNYLEETRAEEAGLADKKED